VKKDYLLTTCLDGVSTVSKETTNQIKEYIEDYGETLIQLPEETRETLACIWMGIHRDVLVDLWTEGEGRSDLVLGAEALASETDYIVHVGMVYVP
jgi:hypothetical protein